MFAIHTDGTGFTNLHTFSSLVADTSSPLNVGTNSDGGGGEVRLVLSGNKLYGTAALGGSSGQGTVFALNTDGTGFTNLHSFTQGLLLTSTAYLTNSDGASPNGGLILSGNTLYGTANAGGSFGIGTVFAVNTDGTGFTNLHSFNWQRRFNPQQPVWFCRATLCMGQPAESVV